MKYIKILLGALVGWFAGDFLAAKIAGEDYSFDAKDALNESLPFVSAIIVAVLFGIKETSLKK